MKITYVSDIENVDVMVAVYTLHRLNFLDYFVCYPKPSTNVGKERIKILKSMGIIVKRKLTGTNKYVIAGSSLLPISKYIKRGNNINTLVITGGFVGCNVYPIKSEDGTDCQFSKSCNFNKDIDATLNVLRSEEYSIGNIILIGKNVYNSERNTPSDLWDTTSFHEVFDMFGVGINKKQYGLLTVWEGAQIILGGNTKCEYAKVYPTLDVLDGSKTKWGSSKEPTGYREVLAAIRIK